MKLNLKNNFLLDKIRCIFTYVYCEFSFVKHRFFSSHSCKINAQFACILKQVLSINNYIKFLIEKIIYIFLYVPCEFSFVK